MHDRSLAAGVTIALVVGLATLPTYRASAGTAEPVDDRPVAGVDVPLPAGGAPAPTADPDAEAQQGWKPPAVTTPAATEVTVAVPAVASARIPGTPLSVAAPAHGAAPTRVSVHVLDRASAARAGAPFLAFTLGLSAGDAAGGAVDLSVDYTGFRHGFGADYATPLRLVSYPACVLTRSDLPACTVATPVPAAVYAVTSSTSGSTGDFSASPLSPAGSWQVHGGAGAFEYSMPVPIPPAPGGLEPDVAFDYSAASVDGEAAGTNTQASWVGNGWDLSEGYVEREYVGCAADGHAISWADLCWPDKPAYRLSLGGVSTEVVGAHSDDQAAGPFTLRADNGWRVQRLTGAGNGDDNGEYWLVTDLDGTRYWFGSGPERTTDAATNSTWTTPVFADAAGKPCYDSASWSASWCQQAWRWNLDRVVDRNGNEISLFYGKDVNHYGASGYASGSYVRSYTAGGYLTSIHYGMLAGQETGTPPDRITFNTAFRCVDLAASCGDPRDNPDPTRFPDVPVDLLCSGDYCTNHAPAFFTTRFLSSIVTQTYDGGWHDVTRMDTTHAFPTPPDSSYGTTPKLWLETVKRWGLDGTDESLPEMNFDGVWLPNRADANTSVGVPEMDQKARKPTAAPAGSAPATSATSTPSSTTTPCSTRRCRTPGPPACCKPAG